MSQSSYSLIMQLISLLLQYIITRLKHNLPLGRIVKNKSFLISALSAIRSHKHSHKLIYNEILVCTMEHSKIFSPKPSIQYCQLPPIHIHPYPLVLLQPTHIVIYIHLLCSSSLCALNALFVMLYIRILSL